MLAKLTPMQVVGSHERIGMMSREVNLDENLHHAKLTGLLVETP